MMAIDPVFADKIPDKWKLFFPELDPEFNPLFLPSGFQLEVALESLVPKSKTKQTIPALIPKSRAVGGGASPVNVIDGGIEWGEKIRDYRQAVANRFWVLNTLKSLEPENQSLKGKDSKDLRELAETISWPQIQEYLEDSETTFAKNMLILIDLKWADPKWMDSFFYSNLSTISGRSFRKRAENLSADEIESFRRKLEHIPDHVTGAKRDHLERLRKRIK